MSIIMVVRNANLYKEAFGNEPELCYLTFDAADRSFKTEVQKGLTPTWHEIQYCFPQIDKLTFKLKSAVSGQPTASDRTIGQANWTLNNFLRRNKVVLEGDAQKEIDEQVPIRNQSGVDIGQLFITVKHIAGKDFVGSMRPTNSRIDLSKSLANSRLKDSAALIQPAISTNNTYEGPKPGGDTVSPFAKKTTTGGRDTPVNSLLSGSNQIGGTTGVAGSSGIAGTTTVTTTTYQTNVQNSQMVQPGQTQPVQTSKQLQPNTQTTNMQSSMQPMQMNTSMQPMQPNQMNTSMQPMQPNQMNTSMQPNQMQNTTLQNQMKPNTLQSQMVTNTTQNQLQQNQMQTTQMRTTQTNYQNQVPPLPPTNQTQQVNQSKFQQQPPTYNQQGAQLVQPVVNNMNSQIQSGYVPPSVPIPPPIPNTGPVPVQVQQTTTTTTYNYSQPNQQPTSQLQNQQNTLQPGQMTNTQQNQQNRSVSPQQLQQSTIQQQLNSMVKSLIPPQSTAMLPPDVFTLTKKVPDKLNIFSLLDGGASGVQIFPGRVHNDYCKSRARPPNH